VAGTLAELTVQEKRMAAALSSTMMATDLADYLVRKGATFRESHGAVGSLVRQAEEQGVEMTELPLDAYKTAHPLFGDDVMDALSAKNSVAHREAVGGTGPQAVRAQLDAARAALQPTPHDAQASSNELEANVVLNV
jgi:argininosuccinate lyase